ncbi:PucR family transcriptional regulator [Proteiniclasticum sp. C24MP]|uniref:PucR family transcriptional regulator n=1 Tax=Proteiniclasticum sp. C24MP TaxID=3374101 RepID=UPI003754B90B
MMNPENTNEKDALHAMNMDTIRNALSGESENKYDAYSPILVGTAEMQEAFLFLKEYFGKETVIIELQESLLVLIDAAETEAVAEALNTAFLENFFNSSTVLYMRNGRNLRLEEKTRILLSNHDLIRRSRRDYRIATSEDLALLSLADGLTDDIRNRYMNEIVPFYKQLSPELRLTLMRFYEENLSMSRTAKKLFIHRNTLTYRIGKIQQITGLDIRKINEALMLVLSSYLIDDSPNDIL